MRKTSLMALPEGDGLVLHLAISPREILQVTSDCAAGKLKDSTTMYM